MPADVVVQPKPDARLDVLLECLVALTRLHDQPATHDALRAGLPLEEGRLTPSLFARAASRAGLSSRILRRPLDRIQSALLPAVLLLAEDEACVLLGWNESGDSARVVLPDLGDLPVDLPRAELERRYIGSVIFARPKYRFDRRTPEVGEIAQRHWFWGAMADSWLLYRDVLLAALLINLFALALPIFTMNVYDRVVPNRAVETLWMLAVGLMVVLTVDFVLRMVRGYFIDLASKRIDVRLSSTIMERVLGLRLAARPLSVGAFAANLRSFETVRDFITSATVTALIDLPFAVIFLLVIIWIDWPLGLPLAFGALIVLAYAMAIQFKLHALAETSYRAGAQRNATLIEGLVGLETIKTCGAEGVIQRRWEKTAAYLADVGTQLRLLSASAINGSLWMQQFVSLAVIVVGVYRIADAQLTMGGLIACSMLASRALAPVSQVAGLLVQYHNASTALTSLDQVMALPVERPADARFVSRTHVRGDIEFREVHFAYPNQESEALRGVSFRIAAGEHVALIGRVGSGKSTLQKLMLGLYEPSDGAVRIDGIDVRQLDPAELRRHVGYVPQDANLFYGTLRENIALGKSFAEDAQIIAAAELAGIAEFVNSHPRGFDMVVGERGESLSGGQRQAVALARAVLGDPPIVLLDEPTGAMDFSTEEGIKQRLSGYAAGKTLVLVTHRTSLLDIVDRIIVVDGGRIMADGPKSQVIEALSQGRVGRAG
ncbi:MAG: type I secretion system permease/ATPase [Rhodocyclaceae bacterium]